MRVRKDTGFGAETYQVNKLQALVNIDKVLSLTSTRQLLSEWGRWAMIDNGIVKGHPRAAAFRNLMGNNTLPTPMISDDQAEIVNQEVLAMKRHSSYLYDALTTYYLGCRNVASLAREIGTGNRTARNILYQAESWMDGALAKYRE